MLILLVTTFLGILLAHHDGVLQDFNRYVLQGVFTYLPL